MTDFAQAQKLGGLGKKFCSLFLQVVTVNDHDDGRRTKLIGTAQRELTGKERHSVGFATAGRAEICAAFTAAAGNGKQNAFPKQTGGEELRIAADNFPFFVVKVPILKIDIVTEDFQKTDRRKHTLDHGFGFGESLIGNFVIIFDPPPCIKVFIGSQHRSQTGLDSVRNHCQRTIVEQVGNIPPVTDIDLFIGVKYGGIGFGRAFQLDHAQRNTIDIKQNIRSAVFPLIVVDIIHGKLIDHFESVVPCIIVINKIDDMRRAVRRSKSDSIHQHYINIVHSGKLSFSTGKGDFVHNIADFIGIQKRILFFNKGAYVIGNKHLGTA